MGVGADRVVRPYALLILRLWRDASHPVCHCEEGKARRGNPFLLDWRGYFMRRGEVTLPYAMYRKTLRRAA